MTPLLVAGPTPSPDDARTALRQELLRPEYHERDVLQQVFDALQRLVDDALVAASGAPPLTTLAAVVAALLLVLALGWLLSRARGSARLAGPADAVLAGTGVGADELTRRAHDAAADGRWDDVVVEAFRALTLREVERGLLADNPGATAREVALALGAGHPPLADAAAVAARTFDLVRYGERRADEAAARGVLDLLDTLVGARR